MHKIGLSGGFLGRLLGPLLKTGLPLIKLRLLIKGVSERNKNEAKEQKGGFLGMLLGTFGANLLGNLLAGKGTIEGEGTIRAGQDF